MKEVFGGMPHCRIALETGLLIPSDYNNYFRIARDSDTIPTQRRPLQRLERAVYILETAVL
jgi:hypothetical protein